MIVVPIESEGHTNDRLLIVFDATEVRAIKANIPVQFNCKDLGANVQNPAITICMEGEEGFAKLVAMGKANDQAGIEEFVRRRNKVCDGRRVKRLDKPGT